MLCMFDICDGIYAVLSAAAHFFVNGFGKYKK